LSEKEVLERAEITVKMANVTGKNAQEVSDQLTAIWNNFDNGSKSLEYYVDVITALGAATASSTDEISQGLEKFAAVAETAGLSYEYATAALATVTAETRQSADVVGTAFKTLFARIQGLKLGETLDDGTTLNSYSEALMKVGINIKDSNGELKDMDIILNEMGAKWNNLARDQQVALAQAVGGIRQYNQLIALMDNWDVFQTNLQTIETSTGAL
jgi:TP901 family phage tail tape measure protein